MRFPSYGIYFALLSSLHCVLAFGTTLPKESLESIFVQHAGLDSTLISNATFSDLKFEIGITKDAKIIRSLRGGTGVVKWGDTSDNFVSIRIFSQRLYDDYSQDMDVPVHILKGISSSNSLAALENGKLLETWKTGSIKDIGAYCVGELRGGLAGDLAPTGYFLDEEYGFCLQINTLKSSGINVENIEDLGKSMIAEVKALAESENLIPNPLNKGGPLVVTETRAPKRKTDTPSKISSSISGTPETLDKPTNAEQRTGKIAILLLAALGLLVACILHIRRTKR